MEERGEMPAERARRALAQRLESLQRAGVAQLARPPVPASGAAADADVNEKPPVAATVPADPAPPEPGGVTAGPELFEKTSAGPSPASRQDRSEALRVLQQEVAGCTRCAELVGTRTQTVFGVGNPEARLCFFGEAPGADEDRLGEPFVGRAGQLLTRIIEACTLTRDDVYILNVLKCRPPGNRNPLPDEADNCRRFYQRQLEIIRPEFLCCLGAVAATTLLETNQSIGRLRGRFHNWRGIKVIATYHPAYLLRNPAAKRNVWDDMKMLMREMGIPVPATPAQ